MEYTLCILPAQKVFIKFKTVQFSGKKMNTYKSKYPTNDYIQNTYTHKRCMMDDPLTPISNETV